MSEIALEFVLRAMPPGKAKLYRALVQLLPAPVAEMPNLGGRQIKMEVLAELTGYSERWVIELLNRLEEEGFIRTDGGSGAVKWIWLRPLGVADPTELTQKGPGKAPRAAAYRPTRRRKETTPSPKPPADASVAPPLEKPAAIPERRRKGPIPPADPAVGNPVAPATALIPPPPPPAPDNPVVAATTVTPAPSRARGGPAARNSKVRATKIAPLPSRAPGGPAPGNPVMSATRVTPPPPEPAEPAIPAKRISPRKSTKKLPAGHSHWESAPIEEMVAYAYSQPVTPEFIHNLKTPGMSGGLLVLALERLCQRIERYGLMPYTDRSSLVTALRTILSDL